MFTTWSIKHGELTEAAKVMKRSFAGALRRGIALNVAIKMAADAADDHNASEEEVSENMLLLLAAWGEVHRERTAKPAPGSDATTADGRFVSGDGYGGERQ
jgi:hypothetical protein